MTDKSEAREVLIVDDVHDVTDSLATMLELAGFRVTAAYDPVAAMKALETCHPSAVILDVRLPGMSGFELARRFRTHPATQNATIVAVTGAPAADYAAMAQGAGIDHWFVKPLSLKDLYATIGQPVASPPRAPQPAALGPLGEP